MTGDQVDEAGDVVSDTADLGQDQPPWFDDACKIAITWLDGSSLNSHQRRMYAANLGVRGNPCRWAEPVGTESGTTSDRAGSPYFTWCATNGINPFTVTTISTLEAWRDVLRAAGVSGTVLMQHLWAVNGWYGAAKRAGAVRAGLCVTSGITKRSPGAKSQAPLFTREEIQALMFAAAHDRSQGWARVAWRERNMMIIELLAVAGLRPVEVSGLRIRDVTDGEAMTSPRTVTVGRGPARRDVVLADSTAAAVDRYLAVARRHADRDEWLLRNTSGGSIGRSAIIQAVGTLCTVLDADAAAAEERAAAELLAPLKSKVNAEAFRRFAATTAYEAGVPVEEIRVSLGLRSPEDVEYLLPSGSEAVASTQLASVMIAS